MPEQIYLEDLGNTRAIGLGSGEWAIMVFDAGGNCLKEFVGNNGEWPEYPADDLWADFEEWRESLPTREPHVPFVREDGRRRK